MLRFSLLACAQTPTPGTGERRATDVYAARVRALSVIVDLLVVVRAATTRWATTVTRTDLRRASSLRPKEAMRTRTRTFWPARAW